MMAIFMWQVTILVIVSFEFSGQGLDLTVENLSNTNAAIYVTSGIGRLSKQGVVPIGAMDKVNLISDDDWSGRIAARYNCGNLSTCFNIDNSFTLFEITCERRDNLCWYDISLVDGHNVGMYFRASNSSANCTVIDCPYSEDFCPKVLYNEQLKTCESACFALKKDEFCCKGSYNDPRLCLPSAFSKNFKNLCPKAYSYAYDDPTSLFECPEVKYTLSIVNGATSFIRKNDSLTVVPLQKPEHPSYTSRVSALISKSSSIIYLVLLLYSFIFY